MTIQVAESTDVRETSRVVATVLWSSGAPRPEEVARANEGLARLGRPPLSTLDVGVATPEELASAIPAELRPGLIALLFDLAGVDPIRQRVAQAYERLWGRPSRRLASPRRSGAAATVAQLIVGPLPRHHEARVSEETPMNQPLYRQVDPRAHVAPSTMRDPMRERVERIQKEFLEVVAAVERVLVGKRWVVERALMAMAARGHVLLVDAPGVGKTLLCRAICAACGVRFGRVQFTPDLLPMDLTGAAIYEAHEKRFVFRQGPLFTQFLLADEINRATPKTQSALLEVMEERTVTVDGTTYAMTEPFHVLATMNPFDHDGTFPLPAAQIDRFMVMLELGPLAPEDEVRVLDTHLGTQPALASIDSVISGEALLDWQRTVSLVHVAPAIKRAAVDYVNGLRRGVESGHGVSPRATLAWVRAAQARAMLSGREFVTVEDLLDVSPEVLRHRLWISAAEVRDRLRAMTPHAAGAEP
jgi:MoxR-like ATPase